MKQPVIYLPHGGGPCFFMDWNPADMWDNMGAYLRSIPALLPEKPKALLIISAHWETEGFTVQAKPSPDLLFDYYGFPDHTYELKWPAQGSPELAKWVEQLCMDAGIPVAEDNSRDFDHGVFIPMMLAFPEADIPTIQLSMRQDLDPSAHLALGRALAPLRDQGVLIIGSGMSFHSIRALMGRGGDPNLPILSKAFDDWLTQTLNGDREGLNDWAAAPGARLCHPREDHLLPLMVAAGAANGDPLSIPYHEDSIGPTGAAVSAFHFG